MAKGATAHEKSLVTIVVVDQTIVMRARVHATAELAAADGCDLRIGEDRGCVIEGGRKVRIDDDL